MLVGWDWQLINRGYALRKRHDGITENEPKHGRVRLAGRAGGVATRLGGPGVGGGRGVGSDCGPGGGQFFDAGGRIGGGAGWRFRPWSVRKSQPGGGVAAALGYLPRLGGQSNLDPSGHARGGGDQLPDGGCQRVGANSDPVGKRGELCDAERLLAECVYKQHHRCF